MALVLRQWLHTFTFRDGRVSTPSFKGIMSRIFTTQQEMARYSDDRNNDNKEYYSNIVPLIHLQNEVGAHALSLSDASHDNS